MPKRERQRVIRATNQGGAEIIGHHVEAVLPGPIDIVQSRFEVTRRLTSNGGGPRVVLVSSRDARDFGPLVEGSGASGFVPKNELSGAAVAALLE